MVAVQKKKKALKTMVTKRRSHVKRPAQAKAAKRTENQKGKIGSSFEDFLKEEGNFEDTTALAIKRVLTWQLEQEMAQQGVTKATMATRMKTSRSQLDRLLDPDNEKVQLDTLHRAALALGKRMMIRLEDTQPAH